MCAIVFLKHDVLLDLCRYDKVVTLSSVRGPVVSESTDPVSDVSHILSFIALPWKIL